MDIDADYGRRQAQMDYAGNVVAQLLEQFLTQQIHPLSIAHAFFFSGLGPVTVSNMDVEEKLMICDMLQTFIGDTKASIESGRN